jgi:hypothetical protein
LVLLLVVVVVLTVVAGGGFVGVFPLLVVWLFPFWWSYKRGVFVMLQWEEGFFLLKTLGPIDLHSSSTAPDGAVVVETRRDEGAVRQQLPASIDSFSKN